MHAFKKSESFQAYEKAVIGSERARYTYMKRLNAIDALARGFKGKRILDIGCGFGFRTIGVAQNGALSVSAIDLDEQRIKEAAFYAQQRNVENVNFRVMDATCLEFEDESFDLVLADELIHHLDNLPMAFKEIYRVLKNRGLAIISDHNRLSVLSELVRTVYFGKEKERVLTAKEVKKLFIEANFHNIVWKHTIFTIPFSNAPKIYLKFNSLIESLIESTPILRTQCGIYVIKGVK